MTRSLWFTDIETQIAKRNVVALDVVAHRPKKRGAGATRIQQTWRLTLCAGIIAIAGCGSSYSSPPTAGAAAIRGVAEPKNTVKSWMGRGSSKQDLLYVSSEDRGVAYVYSYPQRQLVGTLLNLSGAAGECSDSIGNVFITTNNPSGSGTIYEYAHGGTSPIEVLADPGEPNGCAVDPKTGDLAVANPRDESNPYYSYRGDLAVYTQAQGSPKMYYSHDPAIAGFDFCGYDDNGNLYLSAGDEYHIDNPLFVRLPDGGTSFRPIALDVTLYNDQGGSSVQWDGRHMTVSSSKNRQPMLIYRLRISGDSAKAISTTKLSSAKNLYNGQLWIQGDTVIGLGPYKRGYQDAFFWPYPAGGRHGQSIRKVGAVKQKLWGVTVSVAQSR